MVLKVTLEISFQVFPRDQYKAPFSITCFHNFADDNTLACFSKTIQELIGSSESECEVALNWFNENKMIVNPGKLKP